MKEVTKVNDCFIALKNLSESGLNLVKMKKEIHHLPYDDMVKVSEKIERCVDGIMNTIEGWLEEVVDD